MLEQQREEGNSIGELRCCIGVVLCSGVVVEEGEHVLKEQGLCGVNRCVGRIGVGNERGGCVRAEMKGVDRKQIGVSEHVCFVGNE